MVEFAGEIPFFGLAEDKDLHRDPQDKLVDGATVETEYWEMLFRLETERSA